MVTKLEISRAVLEAIRSHAASDPAREVCGLLFGSPERIDSAQAVANVAGDPARHFEIDPAALFRAIRAERASGPKLSGYYHSHPHGAAEPSPRDVAMAGRDGKIWIILGRSAAKAWRSSAYGFEPVALSYPGNES